MELRRRSFQGVLNILSFNRHFYYSGITVLLVLVFLFQFFQLPSFIICLLVVSFSYGLIMPLIVSAYVYDFSGFYKFEWLSKILKSTDQTNELVNINAGFDETSYIIQAKFANSHLLVFDFYNPIQHTEQAIIRARNVSDIFPNTTEISSQMIPLESESVDIVFLISAIHEIRANNEKVQFLKECYRICKMGGKVIMVEHLRDLPNFIAFTIGFTHFFSKKVWGDAFQNAGFVKFKESKFTPFMSIFICEK